ncbi:hypothetical protein G9P44_000746 [Scheffersomyces stipitis]|nr:hypothetical protein G9P44_000746 [Scheffersomyces stipitis]
MSGHSRRTGGSSPWDSFSRRDVYEPNGASNARRNQNHNQNNNQNRPSDYSSDRRGANSGAKANVEASSNNPYANSRRDEPNSSRRDEPIPTTISDSSSHINSYGSLRRNTDKSQPVEIPTINHEPRRDHQQHSYERDSYVSNRDSSNRESRDTRGRDTGELPQVPTRIGRVARPQTSESHPYDRKRERDSYSPRYEPRKNEHRSGNRDRSPRRTDSYRGDHRERDHYRGQYRERRDIREREIPDSPSSRDQSMAREKPTETSKKEEYSKNELQKKIKELSQQLSALTDVESIEDKTVIDSRWGVKPKGFEEVTAQRAKLSGLFPLPGYPRPVDFTKLEGMVKDRSNNKNDILFEMSHIDPVDAKSSRLLILHGVDFDKINHLKVVDYLNSYLKKIDIEETSLSNNIDDKRKTKDDKSLIVEFHNSTCCTIISSLVKLQLKFNEFKDDAELAHHEEETFTIKFERPNEYVVQTLPPYTKQDEDIKEKVVDSPRKITLKFSPEITETQIITELNLYSPVRAFQMFREVGTKVSLGMAFVEFFIDPASYKHTDQVIERLQELLQKLDQSQIIDEAFFSCIIPHKTSIQDCQINFDSLKHLVRNENVSTHPKSRVIQLLNVVTPKDLVEDSNYQFILKDIKREASRIGTVVSIKIPRPANEFTPGLAQFSVPGLGKVFIEFEDEEVAFRAIMELAGRSYNDRCVICAFYNVDDYRMGLY